jgi:hypothetical protein
MRAERGEGKGWDGCAVLLQQPVHAHPEGGGQQKAKEKAAAGSQRVSNLFEGIDQVECVDELVTAPGDKTLVYVRERLMRGALSEHAARLSKGRASR